MAANIKLIKRLSVLFSVSIAMLFKITSAYYKDLEPGKCYEQPRDAVVPINHTRLYFIGPHHTGTTSYIKSFFEFKSLLNFKNILSHPGHEMHWAYAESKKIFKYDVIADTPYRDWYEQEDKKLEFGHPAHPDVRMLFTCFPRSLYVINTRPLLGYLRTKVMWELGFHGNPSPPCQTPATYASDPFHFALSKTEKTKSEFYRNQKPISKSELGQSLQHPNITQFPIEYMSKICQVAYVREKLYLAFFNFISEDLKSRQSRFLITDIEREGLNNIMRRICKFVHIYAATSTSNKPVYITRMREEKIAYCNNIKFPEKHRYHQSLYANIRCETESFQHVLLNRTGINAVKTYSNKRNTKSISNACYKLPNNFTEEELLKDSSIFLFLGGYKSKYQGIVDELSTRFAVEPV